MKYRIRWENKNFDDMGTLTIPVFSILTGHPHRPKGFSLDKSNEDRQIFYFT